MAVGYGIGHGRSAHPDLVKATPPVRLATVLSPFSRRSEDVLTTPPLRINLLGPAARCLLPGTTSGALTERRLDRRTAGLLAYLTLEGRTPRSALAGLLWPDVTERAARGNLRQSLHRLRSLNPGLVDGDDVLRLCPALHVDVAQVELAAFGGQETHVLAHSGKLLDGHEYDDCPEFMEWLAAQRERLHARRVQAHARLCGDAETAGDFGVALQHAEHWVDLDPVSEVAHRRVIGLQLRRGDRGAALKALQRCVATLARELGVSPSRDTLELAQLMPQTSLTHTSAAPTPGRAPSSAWVMPATVPLVGRQTEWSRLVSGWAGGQLLLVSGPAGVGKSKLLLEFLGAQGPLHCFQGRPGDEAVPYLSLSRAFRQLLPLVTETALGSWVRAELARVLPELGEAPRPAGQGMDPLRFLEATQRFLALAAGGEGEDRLRVLMLDDFQCCDEASRQVWIHALANPVLTALGLRGGLTFRADELPPDRLEAMTQLVAAEAATMIALDPLHLDGVTALLNEVLPAVPAGLAAALEQHTGGNPLFLLETLRSLGESDALERTITGPLPLPARVGPLIARRLERLSPEARRVAQVAAVAGADLTPELAAAVLEVHPLDLARPWTELETAHIMRGQAFAHDLMAEAARTSVPSPIRTLLHRRVAAALELAPGRPEAARIARHWQEAGDAGQAAHWWVQAGLAFLNRGAWTDAAAAFTGAVQGTDTGQADLQDALYGLGRTLLGSQPEAAETALLRALAARPGPRRETELRATLSELYRLCGRLDEGGEQIRQAIGGTPDDFSGEERSRLWRTRFWIELRSGRLTQAEEAVRQAHVLAPHDHWVANEHALLLWHSGRFPEAAQMYEDLARRRQEHGETEEESRAAFGSNRAWTCWALGRNTEADALLGRPYQPAGFPFDEALRQSNRSTVLTSLGRSAEALLALEQAETVMRAYPLHLVDVLHRRSVICHRADRHEEALPLLLEGLHLARGVGDPYRLSYTLASLGAAQAHLGELTSARSAAEEALNIAGKIRFPLTLAIAHQGNSVVARLGGRKAEAARHATSAAEVARACGMVEQVGQAQLLRGLATGERGPLEEALELGQRHALPDLVWRAASALNEHADGYLGTGRQARDSLKALAPPGWY